MSVVNNCINQGSVGQVPPGDPSGQNWYLSGIFAVHSASAVNLLSTLSCGLQAPTLDIGTLSSNTQINVGYSSSSIVLNGAISAPNLATQTAATAVVANTQPSGWSIVIQNNTTKEFAVFVQS